MVDRVPSLTVQIDSFVTAGLSPKTLWEPLRSGGAFSVEFTLEPGVMAWMALNSPDKELPVGAYVGHMSNTELKRVLPDMKKRGIRSVLQGDDFKAQVKKAKAFELDAVRFDLGAKVSKKTRDQLRESALEAEKAGLRVHIGGNLNFQNVREFAGLFSDQNMQLVDEVHIGEPLMKRAIEVGLNGATKEMVALISAP